MKVLLLNGSPHEKGCTYTALCEVAGALEKNGIETEIFQIGNKPVAGCIGCGSCRKTGRCVFEGGVNEFVEKAKEADGFIFGSPVYYANASGQISSFLDRAFYLPVLEHGTRKYTRRGGTGQGRLADYAHIGQQYGMAAALHPGRKRAGNRSSRAGAEGKNKLYPLRKERACKGGRCLLGTSSAFFVGEFYVRRIIL